MTDSNYKRTIFAWSMYDFANQPFTTLVVTFIYGTFFTKVIAENEIIGTTLWSRAITITALFVAFLSPIMGALADRGGYRKVFLIFWTWVCVVGTFALYFPLPGQVVAALTCFIIANIGFEMGGVFCNAYLPDIAPREKIGRVSGYGWSFGYVGGLLALALCFVLFVQAEVPAFGFTTELGENIRATNLFIAIWFAIFSIPTFIWVKDAKKPERMGKHIIKSSFSQLKSTFGEIRRYKQMTRFLLARLLYNDGLITIFAFGGIYASGTFGFTFNEIFLFGIVLNVTAGLGAFGLGFLDDILGGKKTIQLSNLGLIAACILAVTTHSKDVFWFSGVLIGIFAGPNQSASRSLMARFIPKEKENEFFGFFAFSGKATAFIGPFLLGLLTEVFNSQRMGIAVVAVLLTLGAILLNGVDEEEGISAAG
ncbi:MAG: MFS transporter [Candidatus Marinimicrobia bacterium]|nr:MFS transporter [Candidatus Neomarinimicrobiota bacterium]